MAKSNYRTERSHDLFRSFMQLEQPDDAIMCEYVWIDANGEPERLRNKTKILDFEPGSVTDCPVWDGAGYCSNHAQLKDPIRAIYLVPAALFRDPFRRGKNKLVLCEVYNKDMEPHPASTRTPCMKVMKEAESQHPWFGMEQEYHLMDADTCPVGQRSHDFPTPEGLHWCGAHKVLCRNIIESHARACMYAGVKMAGLNAEYNPGQWEFQVGPCEGIDIGDHLWIARYILLRVAEAFGVFVNFDPHPYARFGSLYMPSGCHANFSTEKMREDGGLTYIDEAIKILKTQHEVHMPLYDPHGGADNKRRMTGVRCVPSMDACTSAVEDKDCSLRIPLSVHTKRKGYFEDRRPSSNCDPYVVARVIVNAACI